ncbi:MAG: non-heme iron oxygenase ferredoxin subunit [Halioglobus sp.]|nr:non-heme iron oxygenase ferredoxin subunit [Halioglobus sp.]
METVQEYRVQAADLPPRGKTLCVEVAGTEILLCHTAEGFFAVDNLCTHAAARLCEGKLKGHRILCPLHSGAFDVRDGSALTRPATVAIKSYPVHAEGEDIIIAL